MGKIKLSIDKGLGMARIWAEEEGTSRAGEAILLFEGKPWLARQTLRAVGLALSDPGYLLTKVFGDIPPSDREQKEDHA